MYCKNCGKEIDDKAVICPYCGVQQKEITQAKPDDAKSVGYGILGFLVPLIGLILFIVWHKDYPLRAKSILTGFIVGIVIYVLLIVVLVACTAAAGSAMLYYY